MKPSETAVSINVLDWVSGERLWYVHLLNRKPPKDESELPSGPHTDIYARGLTSNQLAVKITSKLREYVTELSKAEGGKR